jgi:hypothetical protein
MYIPRLLLLSLLISVWVAPSSAQSSPAQSSSAQSSSDQKTVSSQRELRGLVAPPEFRAHDPLLPDNVRARVGDIQRQPPSDPSLAQNDANCFAIRSYRVARDDPESDSTRLAGYSECQPAARFQMKTAVDSREIVPR